ncbi:MAG: DNA cytosine methyltransferase [Dehalococcoidia bacterium]|nr:MAG: DNA cytosine methyltransferase [Dehalococcoidia bacterium]
MKVLVACEFSGVVRDAFLKRGHDAWSCDLLPCESPIGARHYQGDVLSMIDFSKFDLMIAHPPCTHLSKAGAWCWKFKEQEQREALDFVRKLLEAPVLRICLENPVGKINTAVRKPDQIIHPWMFGDPWLKETCLWLKDLPVLRATNKVEPQGNWVKPGNKRPWRRFDAVPEGGRGNTKDRSRSFQGIAEAMADQWGSL